MLFRSIFTDSMIASVLTTDAPLTAEEEALLATYDLQQDKRQVSANVDESGSNVIKEGAAEIYEPYNQQESPNPITFSSVDLAFLETLGDVTYPHFSDAQPLWPFGIETPATLVDVA